MNWTEMFKLFIAVLVNVIVAEKIRGQQLTLDIQRYGPGETLNKELIDGEAAEVCI